MALRMGWGRHSRGDALPSHDRFAPTTSAPGAATGMDPEAESWCVLGVWPDHGGGHSPVDLSQLAHISPLPPIDRLGWSPLVREPGVLSLDTASAQLLAY